MKVCTVLSICIVMLDIFISEANEEEEEGANEEQEEDKGGDDGAAAEVILVCSIVST